MQNFEQKAKLYADLDTQEKQIKSEKKPLSADLKAHMKDEKLKNITVGDFTLDYSEQERTKVNEEAMVEKLKALGFDDAVKTVEVPDDNKIQDLMYSGDLNPVDLDDCIARTNVQVLKVKKVKK